MSFLRKLSTARLLALCAAVTAAVGATAAVALAATGGGPTPPPRPLPQAIHTAITGPSVSGITAQITFTNHLIDSGSIQGADPLLSGASGRLWVDGTHLRLELQSQNGDDAQILVSGNRLSVYDTAQNTVFEATLPAAKQSPASHVPPSLQEISSALTRLARYAQVSGAVPGNTGGQPSYSVTVTPKHDGGLLGQIQLAWDAAHGIPLQVAVYSAGNSSPVLELQATSISYGSVPASTFAIPQPAGAKVVNLSPPAAPRSGSAGSGADTPVTGLGAVQAQLPFTVSAPAKLVGMPLGQVRLIRDGSSAGALVTYGSGLGAIAVLETAAGANTTQLGSGSQGGGLSLPSVSINGATGHELDTALGTVIQFNSGGVSYTVLGSVPPVAAEAAARSIG